MDLSHKIVDFFRWVSYITCFIISNLTVYTEDSVTYKIIGYIFIIVEYFVICIIYKWKLTAETKIEYPFIDYNSFSWWKIPKWISVITMIIYTSLEYNNSPLYISNVCLIILYTILDFCSTCYHKQYIREKEEREHQIRQALQVDRELYNQVQALQLDRELHNQIQALQVDRNTNKELRRKHIHNYLNRVYNNSLPKPRAVYSYTGPLSIKTIRNNNGDACPICLEPLINSEDLETLICRVCKSSYHIQCGIKWGNKPCPTCRNDQTNNVCVLNIKK